MDGIAIANDDGLWLRRRADGEAHLPFMNPSSRNHQVDEGRGRSLANNSALTIWKMRYIWRMWTHGGCGIRIRSVAAYLARIPFFVFRFLKGERHLTEAVHVPNLSERDEENVIEGHTITNTLAVETEEAPSAAHVENISYEEQMEINSQMNPPKNSGCHISTPNLVPVNHNTDTSNTEQCKDDSSLVEANPLTCRQDTSPQEPNTDYFQPDGKELCKEQEFGPGKVDIMEETPALLNSSSSSRGNDNDIPKNFPHMVAQRMTKYLQALEYLMLVPGKSEHLFWNQTTQRRAFILATLLAIAMWARNSKHLHHAIPCIEGLAINVHLRSRL